MAERVTLFPTCVVDTVAPQVGVSVVRVLRRLGLEVDAPRDATCCGQPAWNAGAADEAASVAETTLDALDATEGPICVPAGSCATMIRVFWPELFELTGDTENRTRAQALAPRVKEFSELIAEHGDPGAEVGGTVAYHHSCHMLRELGIREQPTGALAAAGCEIVRWSADDRCCGFGGLFALKQPETSVAMADDKIDALPDVDALVGCDASCLLHLRGRLERLGRSVPVKHLAEVLDDDG